MKQRKAKPGDALTDDTTEIGKEEISLPDVSGSLKAADEALQIHDTRRWRLCPVCFKKECPDSYPI